MKEKILRGIKKWLMLWPAVCMVMLCTGCVVSNRAQEEMISEALSEAALRATEQDAEGQSQTAASQTAQDEGQSQAAASQTAQSEGRSQAAASQTAQSEGQSQAAASQTAQDEGQSQAAALQTAQGESQSETQDAKTLDENASYTSCEDVALYLETYDRLPNNFITKQEARQLGWEGGSLEPYAPGKCIGGDKFGNYEGLLPEEKGRIYRECDIDTLGAASRGAKRIVYSDDGLIYYTEDHYASFTLLYD